MANSYFAGDKSNAGWEQLESEQAKRYRNGGWRSFREGVLADRKRRCEICDIEGLRRKERVLLSPEVAKRHILHLHHIQKIRTHRHLRFEKSNIVVCCQSCHTKLEDMPPLGNSGNRASYGCAPDQIRALTAPPVNLGGTDGAISRMVPELFLRGGTTE